MAERGEGEQPVITRIPYRGPAKKGAPRQGQAGEATRPEGIADSGPEDASPIRLTDETVGETADARKGRRRSGGKTEPEPDPVRVAADRKGISLILDMIDGVMITRMGPAAAFTKGERDNIEPSAARILARMSPKTVKAITGFADPMMLATGVFMYAMRLSALSAAKAKERADQQPIQIRRETEPTASFVPAGPVMGVRRTIQHDAAGVPTAPVNGAIPKDGIGTVEPALADAWEQ